MAAGAAIGVDDVANPLALALYTWRDAVARRASAGEITGRRYLQHRQPVLRGIVLGRDARTRRGHGGQRELLAGCRFGFRRVGETVAAHPHVVGRLRQIGHDIAALIVGDDAFDKTRGKVGRLGDDPDAGFRSLWTGHDTTDVIDVDGHWPRSLCAANATGNDGEQQGNADRSQLQMDHSSRHR